MKHRIFIASALCATAFAPALRAATMATQPWVTNRIEEASAVLRGEGALAIAAESNRLDAAAAALAALSASVASAATNYTDAVAAEFQDGTRAAMRATYADTAQSADWAWALYDDRGVGYANMTDLLLESTNAALAVASGKQDRLPYATNAIPYAAISGAPSASPEWRVDYQDSDNGGPWYVTNGIVELTVSGSMLSGSFIGWPDGAALFVRSSGIQSATAVESHIRLVGYGTWPTNDFQSVWWRSGTNLFVNVLLEE